MKAKNLRDELLAMKPFRRGSPPWHDKLSTTDQKLKQEIDEIIDAFNRGDQQILRVCPSKLSLAKFLKPKLSGFIKDTKAITDYITARQHGDS